MAQAATLSDARAELIENLKRSHDNLLVLAKLTEKCWTSLERLHNNDNTMQQEPAQNLHKVHDSTSFEQAFSSQSHLAEEIKNATTMLDQLKLKLDESIVGWTSNGSQQAETEPSEWPLQPVEYRRYARQLIMSEVGLSGQLRLRSSSVLIIGAGGLGCPAAAYLAGAGVGRIGVVDGDTVEESNLHRQILHDSTKVGMSKVDSVIEAMRRTNPLPNYVPHRAHLSPETALDILGQYDLILDCTDNPATRYLISDACVLLAKPLVSASALRTDGQLTVLNYPAAPAGAITTVTKMVAGSQDLQELQVPAGGPCYRCIWPKPPPPSAVQTCGEGGILGPVVGAMGVLQALEAIKILAADTPVVSGTAQMHIFSAHPTLSFRSIRLRPRRPNCASCSASATITPQSLSSGSLDYVAFCGGLAGEVQVLPKEERVQVKDFLQSTGYSERIEVISSYATSARTHAIVPDQQQTREQSSKTIVVDTREEPLYKVYHLQDSVNIPYSKLTAIRSQSELPEAIVPQSGAEDNRLLLICARGNDSQYGVLKLRTLLTTDPDSGDAPRPIINDIVGGWKALRQELGVSAKAWPDL